MSTYTPGGVRFNEPALDHLLNQPAGDVGRALAVLGRVIQTGARGRVRKRSTRLARSIEVTHTRDTRGQRIKVGSKLPYALYEHDGTRPHIIQGRGGRMLKYNVGGGRRVYARMVLHPGTKGTRFLVEPMEAAVRSL